MYTRKKMHQLVGKLNRLKRDPKELRGEKFSDVERQIDRAWDKLCQCQTKLQKDTRNITLIEEEIMLAKEYQEWKLARDKFMRQKIKVQWLNYGDLNIKFFHNAIRARRNANRIFSVKDKEGQQRRGTEDISKAFI